MSILIKGMEMPKCCDDCCLLYDCCSCIVTGYSLAMINWDSEHKRLPDCPLIELPDHGDLIDRDVVVARLAEWSKRLIETYGENDEYVNCLSEVLEGLGCDDVVIPAERSEDE